MASLETALARVMGLLQELLPAPRGGGAPGAGPSGGAAAVEGGSMKGPGCLGEVARRLGVGVSKGILPHASREELIQQVCFLVPLLDEGFLQELLALLNLRLDQLLVMEGEAREDQGEVAHV